MNRRGFLAALIAGTAFDPERLLWVPGKKLISIPRPTFIGWDPGCDDKTVTYQEIWFPPDVGQPFAMVARIVNGVFVSFERVEHYPIALINRLRSK